NSTYIGVVPVHHTIPGRKLPRNSSQGVGFRIAMRLTRPCAPHNLASDGLHETKFKRLGISCPGAFYLKPIFPYSSVPAFRDIAREEMRFFQTAREGPLDVGDQPDCHPYGQSH